MLTSFMRAMKAPAAKYPPFALQQAQADSWAMPSLDMAASQAELYQRLSWVQIAVRFIAETVATSPVQVRKLEGEKANQVVNHPFELLLQRPNPNMSRFALLAGTASFLKLNGNAYWWLNRRSQFAPPDEIWLIPSHQIRPIPDGRLYLKGYEYDTGVGEPLPLPVESVCHFKTFNPLNSFVGLSAIEALATVATGDMKMQEWNTKFFGANNAKLPGALTFAQMIPDATWAQIQAEFKRQYGGTERNAMLLRGVGENAVNWVPMAASQKDMEFLSGRQFTKEEIYTAFGMLPGLLDKNATEANSMAAKSAFSEFTIWPMLVSMAEVITNTIMPAYGDNFVLAFDDPRKTDQVLELRQQREYSRTHTIDEIRAKFYEDKPIGDERGGLLVSEIPVGGLPGIDLPEEEKPEPVPPQLEGRDEIGDEYDPDMAAEEAEESEDEGDEDIDAEKAMLPKRAMLDDLRAWKRKAVKRMGEGRSVAFAFESAVIPSNVKTAISFELSGCEDVESVKAVFAPYLQEPGDYAPLVAALTDATRALCETHTTS